MDKLININTIILTVVRHPQDRLISLFNFLNYNFNFETFIYEIMPRKNYFTKCHSSFNVIYHRLFLPQVEYLKSTKENPIEILKFENLNQDFKKFIDKNKFDITYLKHLNNTKNKQQIYYTKEMAEIVYKYYEMDFKEFDYHIYYKD